MALRIAYLTHYAELYGANRSLLDLVLELRSSGTVEPFVLLAQDGPMCEKLSEHGIAFKVFPFATWMHKHVLMGGPHHRLLQRWRYRRQGLARDKENALLMPGMIAACRKWKVGMVHVNSSVIGIGGPLAAALKVPLVWHIRELPFAHYRFRVDGGTGRYRHALRNAHALIAISEAVSADIQEAQGTGDRIHVVYNGAIRRSAVQEMAEGAVSRWSRTVPFRFLQLGLFHPSKAQMGSVDAFARVHAELPNTHLTLAGGGKREDVEERVHELGLEAAVEMPGFVEEPMKELLQAHCLIQGSRYEAMGRATVEAMASGIPVIGHASGATPELIKEGSTGLLFEDVDELVVHMKALAQDPGRARRMGEKAHQEAVERFTVEAMVQGVVEVYRSLGSKKGTP